MALKTFNLNEEAYQKYSAQCKDLGVSMSKQIDMFIKSQIAEEPIVRDDYLKKLERIRTGKFKQVSGSLMDKY
jgi:antitoxin component of RelBE/YafQ-DinJ toxin-antitoxin module